MKKINLKLFYIIISFLVSFEVISEDLFGLEMGKDAKEYFSKSLIDNNKIDHPETKKGFYKLEVTSEMIKENKSPFFEFYHVDLDDNDRIHGIAGSQSYRNIETCISVTKTLEEIVIKKFNITLEIDSASYSDVKMESLDGWLDNDTRVAINCNHYYESENIEMWFFILSSTFQNAIEEYYDSM